MNLKTLAAGLCALALYSASFTAVANGDSGVKPQPPVPPNPQLQDKSPRCLPAAVNECRAGCDRHRHTTTDKAAMAKKINECKADCIRAC